MRYRLAVDRNKFILLINKLHPLGLPVIAELLAEEYKSIVAVYVTRDPINCKALRDGGFHLANSTALSKVQID